MALTIVLGLTILSVANYGNTFEFSGLNPLVQIKSQLKPTIKPFTIPTNQPQQGDQFKSAFGHNSIPGKPFGAPFEQFPPSYQPYQPFRTNYQPFGPYPGYSGPVVYPGHGSYQGPDSYSSASYRFDEANNKPFGFQPYPAPAQPTFNQYKFGPSKKFNKNHPGLAEFNQPGKYFQEHQFGAYHGPEFSSAIVPAEHNIKQSRPKDILLGKPVLSEFGLPKQTNFGFPSPPSFGYPAPNFPAFQPYVSTTPSVKSVPATLIPVNAVNVENKFGGAEITTVVPSSPAQDEPATVQPQQSAEVTGEPSASTPAADPQPANPAQEEAAVEVPAAELPAAEVATDNEVPAAQDAAPAQEQSVPSSEVNEPSNVADAGNEQPASVPETQNSVQEVGPVVVAEEVRETSSAAAPAEANDPSDSTTVSGPVGTEAKSEVVTSQNIVENKPSTESTGTVNLPGLPNGLQNSQFGPVSDTSSLGLFSSSGFPYFGQSAGVEQPSYYPYFDAPKFSEQELKAFAANFGTNVPQSVQGDAHKFSEQELKAFAANFGTNVPQLVQGDAHKFSEEELKAFAASFGTNVPQLVQGDAHKFSEEELKAFAANFGTNVPQSVQVVGSTDAAVKITEGSFNSNPSAEIATKLVSGDKVESGDKTVSDEKKIAVESQSRNIPEAQKKFNSVQVIQDDPFNGQLPLLYDPSNSGSPLDTYKFYSHPSVSALSSQASLASYSPESAFNNFGTQFRQGYLVEGSPSLTPETKTIVRTSQTPISISSADHPLHSQVFKYSQSFVPYPALVAGNVNAATPTTAAAIAAADVSATSTSAPDAAVESSSTAGSETA